MGSGRWSTDVHTAAARHRARTGATAFAYSASLDRRAANERRVHDRLNPYGVMRESRDSAEHPESRAVAVLMDVTGSMSSLPGLMLSRLPQLHGLLQRKGYLAHPQLLFGAIGDATCDRVPLQIGQFESDNRQEDDIMRLYLEGGGGGQKTESYELGLYFMARHTSIDCWEKRRQPGYLFLIGDEMPYDKIKKGEVATIIGDQLLTSPSTAGLMRELAQRYHTYFLLPRAASHGGDAQVLGAWRKLLGQGVIELDEPESICEAIALTIGLNESAITLDEGLNDLRDLGTAEPTVSGMARALQALPTSQAVAHSSTATSGHLLASPGSPRIRRLWEGWR